MIYRPEITRRQCMSLSWFDVQEDRKKTQLRGAGDEEVYEHSQGAEGFLI